LSNVLNIPLDLLQTEQGPGYGGSMLAMVACGEDPSVQAAADRLVRVASTVEPDPERSERYERRYQIFRQLYPSLKEVFGRANRLG
jgi:xylulokinase